MASPAVDVTPTPTSRILWPPSSKVSSLRGDNRLLHARQKLLRLGQRQPQIGYVAGPISPTDLHYIYASHPLACLSRSIAIPNALTTPSSTSPDRSYRCLPNPTSFWTLPNLIKQRSDLGWIVGALIRQGLRHGHSAGSIDGQMQLAPCFASSHSPAP